MTTPTKQDGRPLEIPEEAVDALGRVVDPGTPLLAAAERREAREVLAAVGPHLVAHELRCLAYDLHDGGHAEAADYVDSRADRLMESR